MVYQLYTALFCLIGSPWLGIYLFQSPVPWTGYLVPALNLFLLLWLSNTIFRAGKYAGKKELQKTLRDDSQ